MRTTLGILLVVVGAITLLGAVNAAPVADTAFTYKIFGGGVTGVIVGIVLLYRRP